MGLDLSIEAEGLDRTDLKFPGNQELLIDSIANASDNPVVLVILSAGGIDITTLKNNPKVSAIVWAGYPGAEGGRAMVDVLFGNHNPAGRLPITWYPADYVDQLPMTSMNLRPVLGLKYPGRTYKFYNGTEVYPFGYGLSYTNFSYTIKSAPTKVSFQLQTSQQCKHIEYSNGTLHKCQSMVVEDSRCSEGIKVVVEVKNAGRRDGANVVLVYSAPPSYVLEAPIKRLIGFEKVFLRGGESRQVEFGLQACKSFSIVNEEAYELLPAGEHFVIVGDGDELVSHSIMFRFDARSLSLHKPSNK